MYMYIDSGLLSKNHLSKFIRKKFVYLEYAYRGLPNQGLRVVVLDTCTDYET